MNTGKKYSEDDALRGLIKTAYEQPSVPERLKHKIMLEIARRAIVSSKRKAKLGVIASLSGLGMLLAGCIVLLVNWFPAYLPFLETVRLPELHPAFSAITDTFPFIEQWGGWIVLTLLAGSAAGFIYYLNNLFSSAFPNGDK